MTAHKNILIGIHGCPVEFSCDEAGLAAGIDSDFSAFPRPACAPGIRLQALNEGVRPGELPPAFFRTRRWSALKCAPGRRLVWYPEGALCEYDYTARRGTLRSADPALLRELSYLLILSRAGEELDLRGLHRLHAGALGHSGKAQLFFGPRGAGKTTLLLELLKDSAFNLLSDDTPLTDRCGVVHPFPARIGLGLDSPHLGGVACSEDFRRRHHPPKRLLEVTDSAFRISPALPPGRAFLLRRASRPRISRAAGAASARELLISLVAGYGVPQLAEYFLRADMPDIARKAGILASRMAAAKALIKKADFYIFELSPDAAENAAEFRSFLRSGSAGA